ncbi:MAG: DUF1461 domain-containing protein [Coriobacteriia bacterium]|nr:DUF1461 domain-containing protein [Coriobacteriia bacterium]
MTEGAHPIAARLEVAFGAVAIILVVVGLSLALLVTPPYVKALVSAMGSAELTGLGDQATQATAEDVRRFVTDPQAPMLPATIDGQPAYDRAAVAHLTDVRDVLVPSLWIAGGLAVLVIAWFIVRRRSERGRLATAWAATYAGWTLLAGCALAIGAGALDFGVLFTRFHGLFFADGTWTFPEDALLIRVFPLGFWITAGLSWGLLVVFTAVVLIVLGARARFTARDYGV